MVSVCGAVMALVSSAAPVFAQVCHRGAVGDTGVLWESTFFGPATFVGPLPDDVVIERVDGGTLVTDARGTVGVDRAGGGLIVLVTRQTASELATLHPPLVATPQRVLLTTDSHELVAFTADERSGVDGYVGYAASAGIGERARRVLDEVCGPSDRAARIYVEASSYDELRGRVVRASDRRDAMAAIMGSVLIAGLVIGVLAYRRLAGLARLEQADALLDRRFRELEDRENERRAE